MTQKSKKKRNIPMGVAITVIVLLAFISLSWLLQTLRFIPVLIGFTIALFGGSVSSYGQGLIIGNLAWIIFLGFLLYKGFRYFIPYVQKKE